MNRRLKLLLAFFICLFIFHLASLLVYAYFHQSHLRKSYQKDVMQEMMNVIHMIQATPASQLEQAVPSFSSRYIKVTLTSTPYYTPQVTDLTYWRIQKLIKAKDSPLQFSVSVPHKQWINIHSTAKSSAYFWPHYVILSIELILFGSLVFFVWSISRYTEPLKQFQQAVEQLGIDVRTTQLEEYKGPHIIRETAKAVNRMQNRIQDLINDRTLMLAAISHDLRTPITRLKLRINLYPDENEKQKMLSSLDEMEAMISELIDFSQFESTQEEIRKIELNSFLQTVCHDCVDLNQEVHYRPLNKKAPYLIKELGFKRALTNIIHNACKYGKRAQVMLKEKNNMIEIIVEDEGPGIAEEEIKQVFTPFYRCDHSRSRKIAGTGLGLTIAQTVIRAHGGEINLSNRYKGGLKVCILLPKI